jgi:hypothetical protein
MKRFKLIVTTEKECGSYDEAFGEAKNMVSSPMAIGKNEDLLRAGKEVIIETDNYARKARIVSRVKIIKED